MPTPSFLKKVFIKVLDAAVLRREDAFVLAQTGQVHEEASWKPNLFGVDCIGFKDKKCQRHYRVPNPVCPQRGPYETSEGIYPVMGKRKLGRGSEKMEKTEMDKETRSEFKKLKEKRRSIDVIDRKLLMLLNQRFRAALQIGRIKKEIGKKIHDPGRERDVLEGLTRKNRGPLKEEDLKKIFLTIMKVCRRCQI